MFRKEPFFYGRDNNDQLVKIVRVLGSEEFTKYLKKYKIQLTPILENAILHTHFKRKAWQSFVKPENQRYITQHGIDFLNSLLRYDHQERPTAEEAMQHVWFKHVREEQSGTSNDAVFG